MPPALILVLVSVDFVDFVHKILFIVTIFSFFLKDSC